MSLTPPTIPGEVVFSYNTCISNVFDASLACTNSNKNDNDDKHSNDTDEEPQLLNLIPLQDNFLALMATFYKFKGHPGRVYHVKLLATQLSKTFLDYLVQQLPGQFNALTLNGPCEKRTLGHLLNVDFEGTLWLENCRITDASPFFQTRCKWKPRQVLFHQCTFGRGVVPFGRSCQYMSFSHCKLDTIDCEMIGSKSIESLAFTASLNHNTLDTLTDFWWKRQNKPLKKLFFSGNKFVTKSVKCLERLLVPDSNLEHLVFSERIACTGNSWGVGTTEMKRFASLLCRLKILDLNGCNLDDAAADTIMDALETCRNLVKLSFQFPGLYASPHWAKRVAKFPALQCVEFPLPPPGEFTSSQFRSFLSELSQSTTVVQWSLGQKTFGPDAFPFQLRNRCKIPEAKEDARSITKIAVGRLPKFLHKISSLGSRCANPRERNSELFELLKTNSKFLFGDGPVLDPHQRHTEALECQEKLRKSLPQKRTKHQTDGGASKRMRCVPGDGKAEVTNKVPPHVDPLRLVERQSPTRDEVSLLRTVSSTDSNKSLDVQDLQRRLDRAEVLNKALTERVASSLLREKKLEQELTDSNAAKIKLSTLLTKREQELAASSTQVCELKLALDNQKQELSSSKTKYKEVSATLLLSQKDLHLSRDEALGRQKRLEDREGQPVRLENKNIDLAASSEECHGESVLHLKQALAKQKSELSGSEKRVEELTTSLAHCRAEYDLDSKNETTKRQKELELSNSVIRKLKEHMEKQKNKLASSESKGQELASSLAKCQEELVLAKNEAENRNSELEECKKKFTTSAHGFIETLAKQKEVHKQLSLSLANAQTEVAVLTEKLATNKALVASLESERDQAAKSLAECQEEVVNCRKDLDLSKARASGLRIALDERTAQLAASKEGDKKFAASLERRKVDVAAATGSERMKALVQTSAEQLSKCQMELISSKTETDKVKNDLALSKKETDKVTSELSSSKKESDEIKQELAFFKQFTHTINRELFLSKKEADKVSGELVSSKNETSNAKDELATAKSEIKSLLNRIRKANAQYAVARSEVESLTNTLETLRLENSDATTQEQLGDDLQTANAWNKELRRALSDCQSSLANAESQRVECEADLEQSEMKIAELCRELVSMGTHAQSPSKQLERNEENESAKQIESQKATQEISDAMKKMKQEMDILSTKLQRSEDKVQSREAKNKELSRQLKETKNQLTTKVARLSKQLKSSQKKDVQLADALEQLKENKEKNERILEEIYKWYGPGAYAALTMDT